MIDPQMRDRGESWALAGMLTGRYGALALTRAAGEAAAAERKGNRAQIDLWRSVIADLRSAMEIRPNEA